MTTTHTETEIEQLKRRGLVNRKPISNSVDLELWKAFSQLSEQTGINKSKLLDQAMILLLNHYHEHPSIEKSPVIKLNPSVQKKRH